MVLRFLLFESCTGQTLLKVDFSQYIQLILRNTRHILSSNQLLLTRWLEQRLTSKGGALYISSFPGHSHSDIGNVYLLVLSKATG